MQRRILGDSCGGSMGIKFGMGMLAMLIGTTVWAGTNSELHVGSRFSKIYAPAKYDKPALVIAMHGMGLGSWWTPGAMQFEAVADTANFIVAYPDGENNQWDISGDKDVNFILAIIDSMANRYSIDRNRVYAAGFSMGGMMSWHLSCKIPDKIAAIVPGNGFPLYGMSGCSEKRHVPALHIHGTADNFVKYTDFVNSFLPAQVSRYGCPTTPKTTKPYPVETNGRNAEQLAAGTKSFMDYYGNCEKNGLKSELALLHVDGMIHDWATPNKKSTNEDPAYTGKPLDVNGTWEAWNWMRRHSLTGSEVPVTVPAHRDTVFNGKFIQGQLGWTLNTWDGAAQGCVQNGEYSIAISTAATSSSGLQLVQNGIILTQGKSYELVFDAYAADNRSIEANVELDVSPWTSYLPGKVSFDLTKTSKNYSLRFTMNEPTDSNGRIAFNVGLANSTVYLDNIAIREIDSIPTALAWAGQGKFRMALQGARLWVSPATNAQKLTICLFDANGQKVYEHFQNTSANALVADLSHLQAGVYMVKVFQNGRVIQSSALHLP